MDEILRFDPSVPVWRRVTTRPVTLGGVDLPEGAKLFLWLAAAGRDADVFPDPDTFDPERANPRRTLAFGRGIHFCIGSALGRLEATLALEELTRRFPVCASRRPTRRSRSTRTSPSAARRPWRCRHDRPG